MTIAFRPRWSVGCVEAGTGDPVLGLRLDPTPQTARRIADAGMVLRPGPAGFTLYQMRAGGVSGAPRAPVQGDLEMCFAVRVDPAFWSRYRLDLTVDTGPQLYLSNRIDAADIRPEGRLTQGGEAGPEDAVRIVAPRFAAQADLGASPRPTAMALATGHDPRRDLPDVPVADASGGGRAEIDLEGQPQAVFRLAPRPPGTDWRRIYVSADLAGRGVAGVLDLTLRPGAGPGDPPPRLFVARFRRRD